MNDPDTVRLTKKFLLSLAPGVFILSNLLKSSGKPAFAEFTATLPPARNAQWSRIVAAGANNRLCMIFKDHDEASKWIDQMSTAVLRGEEK